MNQFHSLFFKTKFVHLYQQKNESTNMEEQKKSTLDYTMYYGALLGIFWIIKYCFFIGQTYWVHFIYFYYLLDVVSPLLMYVFYLRYKSQTPELMHGVWRCVLFVLCISFFGSLFESVIIYAHYAFINPDLFANISAIYTGAIDNLPVPEDFTAEQLQSFNQMRSIMVSIFSSKATYLIFNIIGRLFVGLIFSLLIGLLTRNRHSK